MFIPDILLSPYFYPKSFHKHFKPILVTCPSPKFPNPF